MNRIFIEAGHNNADPGAIGVKKLHEADLTKEVRAGVVQALEQLGVPSDNIILDVDSDTLGQTISRFRSFSPTENDYLVSFHFNSVTVPNVSGTEVLVAKNAGDATRQFAQNLLTSVIGVLGTKNRGVKGEDESQHTSLGILHTAAHSALVEICFISNLSDMDSFESNKEAMYEAIAEVIKNHIS
jgi:N-acetylmuramoyl-L-alanine amidase